MIRVPDERYGEELCVDHQNAGAGVAEDDIRTYCRGQIAHYRSKYILFVEGWPMTVSGKSTKIKMREESIGILHRRSSKNRHP